MKNEFYPNLKYPVEELSAYSIAIGIFVISLKSDDDIIRFEPSDVEHFKKWLKQNNVRNIDEEDC